MQLMIIEIIVDTKLYNRIKPLEYTGNSVDLILEKVGLGEND